MVSSAFSKKLASFVARKTPVLLTGLGVVGVFSTAYFSIKATPEAYRQIQDAKSERTDVLTKAEIVKLVWKEYIPAGASAALTSAAIIAVNSVHNRRQAAIVSLYTLSEKALSEYQTKVRETIGEKKEKGIRDAIVEDQIRNNPNDGSTQVIVTGRGQSLCYDTLTGRYFKSDIESIRRAQNDVNAQAINDMYASQNDFYRMVGLPPVMFGEEHGWRPDAQMDISFSSHLSEDGEPCLALEYRIKPIRGYWKMN